MKLVVVSRIACVPIFASMLLLSSCGGGNSAIDSLAANDCTPTVTSSPTVGLEVGINGGITISPGSTSTTSGCGSSTTESDGTIELTDSITTRFNSSEDFDVWECNTEGGANVFYALLARIIHRMELQAFDRPDFLRQHVQSSSRCIVADQIQPDTRLFAQNNTEAPV